MQHLICNQLHTSTNLTIAHTDSRTAQMQTQTEERGRGREKSSSSRCTLTTCRRRPVPVPKTRLRGICTCNCRYVRNVLCVRYVFDMRLICMNDRYVLLTRSPTNLLTYQLHPPIPQINNLFLQIPPERPYLA